MYHASPATQAAAASGRAPGAALDPAIGAAFTAAALGAYLLVPAVVPRDLGFIAAQAALVLVAVIAVIAVRAPRPLAALGLRRARGAYWLAALLIGVTAWYVNARLVALLPVPSEQTRKLEALVDQPALLRALATFAVLPAVCEELVFRGLLARSLGRHLTVPAAVVISAIVFALYHLSLVQALPTLSLGCLLAVIALRADSILPTIAAHAINNAIAIVLSRHDLPPITRTLEAHPVIAFAACVLATGSGLALAIRAPRAA
ncbi:MAG TPA: CPBP family intramembrane glutamic endopeptidase [Kofleriaceae bacterium]|nr:CPBP family intramembrane glutamic endopeptidase [Kofleriaceae bacterium]